MTENRWWQCGSIGMLMLSLGMIGFGTERSVTAGLLDSFGMGGDDEAVVEHPPVPAEYKDKHMPAGGWTDSKAIEEGRKIYMGLVNPEIKCAKCHGDDGKPVKAGARDFRQSKRMDTYEDSFWFWRISEGVPKTKMKPWKELLTEEQRWQVMAFEHAFSHGGKPEAHEHTKR